MPFQVTPAFTVFTLLLLTANAQVAPKLMRSTGQGIIALEEGASVEDSHAHRANTAGVSVSPSGSAANVQAALPEQTGHDHDAAPAGAAAVGSGSGALWEGSKVHVITLDTKDPNEQHRLHGPPGWDWKVHNIAVGRHLPESMPNKDLWLALLTSFHAYVNDLPDDHIVLKLDSNDVMYGGCELDDFVSRFDKLVATVGAKVFFGAEYPCIDPPRGWPAGCRDYETDPKFREEMLHAFNIQKDDQDAWPYMPHVSPRNAGMSPGTSIGLKFLNAGVYAGRVPDVRQLLAEWIDLYQKDVAQSGGQAPFTEQRCASELLMSRPDLVALDYPAALVSNLFGTRLRKADQSLFSWDGAKWQNAVTRMPVCFFHASGMGKNDQEGFVEWWNSPQVK